MINKTTRILSSLLIVMLVLCAFPFTAGAATVSTETALRTNVNKGGTVKLSKDIKISSRLVIPKGITVTLDLNGKKLYRELTECQEDGSVILVEAGAALTLSDTLKAHGGTITGGVAPQGGGIYNRGTLTVTNGVRIVGNRANKAFAEGAPGERDPEDKGGGIYNASGATLSLQGGTIAENEAYYGGGVYSGGDASLTVEPGSYSEVVDGVKKTLESGVTVTNNLAASGCGIYCGSDLPLSGAAEINGNDHNDDIRLENGKKLICGALTYKKAIGVAVEGLEASGAYMLTSGFGANNTGLPEKYFFCPDKSVKLNVTAAQNGEIRLNKNMQKTTVEVTENGKLTKIEEFDSPAQAWDAAKSYCKKNYFELLYEYNDRSNRAGQDFYPKYQTKRGDFDDWYEDVVGGIEDDETNKGKKRHYDLFYRGALWIGEGILREKHNVKITLGSDWDVYGSQTIDWFTDITLDLNGHCVRRTEKPKSGAMPSVVIVSADADTSEGNLFNLDKCSRFTVTDSNPDSDSVKGFKGGVIMDGDGDSRGGCFILDGYAELNILGGTIYNCKTDYHGGAICAKEWMSKINLKDCVFDNCRTEDSSDDCNGGAIYLANNVRFTAENVTFRNCYSEDNGGAIYLKNRPGIVKLKNVTFDNNHAKDNGGAIRIGDINDLKRFVFEAADCTFIYNKAGVDGGAVCVSDNDDSAYGEAIVFRNCTFTDNIARDGSALELDDNSVALLSCTITGNTANRTAAVYVNDSRAVSVGGTTTIKNNDGGNLVLDKDGNRTRVYPVGLTYGADIYIASDSSDKSTLVMKDIDQRQVQYFQGERGTRLEFTKTGEREAKLVVASLFGSGSFWLVITIAGVAIVAGAAIVIKKKRDGRKTEHDA